MAKQKLKKEGAPMTALQSAVAEAKQAILIQRNEGGVRDEHLAEAVSLITKAVKEGKTEAFYPYPRFVQEFDCVPDHNPAYAHAQKMIKLFMRVFCRKLGRLFPRSYNLQVFDFESEESFGVASNRGAEIYWEMRKKAVVRRKKKAVKAKSGPVRLDRGSLHRSSHESGQDMSN
jgi:hypothetical protein